MKPSKTIVLLLVATLAGCAADPGATPEVDRVGEDFQRELLDVLADVGADGAGGAEARERLRARLDALRVRYEEALASADDTGAVAAPLRDPNAPRDVLVVGDSVSAGGSSDGGPGWVGLLEGRHAARNIQNLSIGGTTAMQWSSERPDLVATLDAELARQPETVIVYLGGNDVLTWEPIAGDGVADAESLGRLVEGLLEVLTHVRRRSPGSRILVGTYYDLFDLRSPLIPANASIEGLPGRQYRTSYNTIAVNLAIWALASIAGADVVDVYGPFMNHGYGNIWLGGGNAPYFPADSFDVHPSTAGHEAIYAAFRAPLGL